MLMKPDAINKEKGKSQMQTKPKQVVFGNQKPILISRFWSFAQNITTYWF